MTKKIAKLLSVAVLVVLLFSAFMFSACEETLEEATDLEYELGYGGTHYMVSGIGKETRTEFAIPSEYDGLPVTIIKDNAFKDCKSIVKVVIPYGVTDIYENAFSGCSSLAGVTLPDTIVYIARFAFQDCSALTSVNIPSSVTTIGTEAFANCSSLKRIVIPSSVTTVNNYAFRDCGSLTIYCEAESEPTEWGVDWNADNCHVEWGYVAD